MADNASRGCWVFFVDILWVTHRRRRACRAKSLTFKLKTGLSPQMRGVEDFYGFRGKNGNTHSPGSGGLVMRRATTPLMLFVRADDFLLPAR